MSAFEEKRRFPRIQGRFPVKYKDLRKKDEGFRGTVSRNLSEGGVRFRSDRFISLACRLVVELNVPELTKPIRAVSKITWIKKLPAGDDYEVGNQFLEISRQDKEIIQDLVKAEIENPSL
ncbi:MAG: PilZ domain-containing protein [Candidatus Omnitrophota bacterium]